jgi:hypothetical protein
VACLEVLLLEIRRNGYWLAAPPATMPFAAAWVAANRSWKHPGSWLPARTLERGLQGEKPRITSRPGDVFRSGRQWCRDALYGLRSVESRYVGGGAAKAVIHSVFNICEF